MAGTGGRASVCGGIGAQGTGVRPTKLATAPASAHPSRVVQQDLPTRKAPVPARPLACPAAMHHMCTRAAPVVPAPTSMV